MLDFCDVVEIMHAVTAGEQFIERLRTAQQQQTEQYGLQFDQLQLLITALLPTIDTTAHHQIHQLSTFQTAQITPNFTNFQIHQQLATNFLIANQLHNIVTGKQIGRASCRERV